VQARGGAAQPPGPAARRVPRRDGEPLAWWLRRIGGSETRVGGQARAAVGRGRGARGRALAWRDGAG
jgi:hypothetical protein